MKERKGKLIVIAGIDGSGKKTQLDLLRERFNNEGYRVETTDFPQYGENRFAEVVGRYLSGNAGSPHPYFACLPFAGDRWKAKEEIEEWLSEGIIVISNRYTSANMAHQTARLPEEEREEFLQFLDGLEYEDYGIPREDLVVYLNVFSKTGQMKVDEKGDREYVGGQKRDILEDDREHLEEARGMYLLLAQRNEHWIQIDCCDEEGNLLPREEIHELVYLALQEKEII